MSVLAEAGAPDTLRCAPAMAVVTMKQLLDSGVHFGHQTRRWNPKMKRYIFTERNGIYIIDLQQTLTYIDRAYEFIKQTVAHGGSILFIGTKKQAQEAIAHHAQRVGMPFVNHRWLGGMLTNFSTVLFRADQKGNPDAHPGERQAGEDAGWNSGHAAGAQCGVDRRHKKRADCRRRGPQAGHSGGGHPGHELRSR
jgi:hypothetical protein